MVDILLVLVHSQMNNFHRFSLYYLRPYISSFFQKKRLMITEDSFFKKKKNYS